jgi:cell division protease FtsH
MVRDYGMSASLGPVSLGDEHGPGFLGVKGLEPRAYSEQTALEVDREVQAMVLEAQDRARALVHGHREKLDALAARLLSAEVVEEEEIQRLWGPKIVRPGTIDGRGHAEAPPENPNHPGAAARQGATWVVPQASSGSIPGDGE